MVFWGVLGLGSTVFVGSHAVVGPTGRVQLQHGAVRLGCGGGVAAGAGASGSHGEGRGVPLGQLVAGDISM